MTKRLKREIVEGLELLDTDQLEALNIAMKAMQEENEEEERPTRRTSKAKITPRKAKESINFKDMTKSEQKEYLAKLHVKPKDAGADLARFLKRVAKMAHSSTEKQLEKLGEKKGVEFFFGRGKQTPEIKRERMAAQILVH